MRNAGMHFDRASEIEDELFGDRGTLRDYRDDHTLRQRMTTLWHQVRPIAEKLNQDELDRADIYKRNRQLIRTTLTSATKTPTPTQKTQTPAVTKDSPTTTSSPQPELVGAHAHANPTQDTDDDIPW